MPETLAEAELVLEVEFRIQTPGLRQFYKVKVRNLDFCEDVLCIYQLNHKISRAAYGVSRSIHCLTVLIRCASVCIQYLL